jgi:hypothetical protein
VSKPGTKIIDEMEFPERYVNGVPVIVRRLIWNGGGVSFEVARTDTGADLTEDGAFDSFPTDADIIAQLSR